ncbi:hypothetical protein JG688_00016247 [Phytophthora aleatoria]|uniref:Uncharacterized protein n=1 Tax=Phytophthora aleatoria TaxID=2496075 RepID=A0A8J5LWC0_9STRA|nr:hypothetical protein JG688_00016247 [Phytophthora aleatoria]
MRPHRLKTVLRPHWDSNPIHKHLASSEIFSGAVLLLLHKLIYLNGDSGEEAALAEPWWEVDEIKPCVSTIECNDFRHAITYIGCYTNCYSTRAVGWCLYFPSN